MPRPNAPKGHTAEKADDKPQFTGSGIGSRLAPTAVLEISMNEVFDPARSFRWGHLPTMPPASPDLGTSVTMIETRVVDRTWRRRLRHSWWSLRRIRSSPEVPQNRQVAPTEPTEAAQVQAIGEADDGIRTRDTWLGKPVLYQLSYVRARAGF